MNHVLTWPSVTLALGACQTATQPDPRPSRTFRFVYEASTGEIPAGTREVKLWIPLPVDTLEQKISDVAIETAAPTSLRPLQNGIGQVLCATSNGTPIQVKASYTVTRYETHGGGRASQSELAGDLDADRMIPLDGKVGAVAASISVTGEVDSAARVLYEHTLEHMNYGKPEGVPWGRGDAEWACDSGVGNCTDFHSYFMGLARKKGIPARFEMGFSVPAAAAEVQPVKGYHCWAYYWNAERGWVPVDISEADKAPAKTDYFFGTLDHDRFTLTGGRDLILDPLPKKGALNFFVYPYAEADGVELTSTTRAFSVGP